MRPKNPDIVAVLDAFQSGIISRRLALRRLEAVIAHRLDVAYNTWDREFSRTAEEAQNSKVNYSD